MKATRIRTTAAARRYVASNVAACLSADFDNGSEWMHAGFEGNLDGPKSEKLVHKAARELMAQLRAFSKKRAPPKGLL